MCRRNTAKADEVLVAAAAVNKCPADTLHTMYSILTILATLPVRTAEADRTFSKVERTLTYGTAQHLVGRMTRCTDNASSSPRPEA
jgi:hypothetical protein